MTSRVLKLIMAVLLSLPLFSHAEWVLYDESYTVQEVLLKETRDKAEKNPNMKWRYREVFANAGSQIDKVLIVRDHLIPIVEAYIASLGSYSEEKEAEKKLELLKKIYYGDRLNGDALIGEYNVLFEFGQTRFQVKGIDSTRLAINTGRSVIFNGNALASKQYALADLVQIWLHEIYHAETETPLQTKDEWAAKVAVWVQERTQLTELPNGSVMTLLSLPAPSVEKVNPGASKLAKNYYSRLSFEEQFQEDLRGSFLIFSEDKKKAELLTDVYKACQTYSDFLRKPFPSWDNTYNKVSWPQIRVTDIRKKSDGTVQLDYEQRSLPLQRYQDGTYQKDKPQYSFSMDTSSEPVLPKNRYRINFNPLTSTTDIQRTYAVPLQDGDFEVSRIQDVKNKRYLSIRLNIPDSLKVLKSGSSLHLTAKDLETNANLSLAPLGQRVLNKDEVLLHFEVPQRNVEIGQILIPTADKEGTYSEMVLRPSKAQILNGRGSLESADLKVTSFEVTKKELKKDPMLASLKLQSRKRIAGITLEMEHSIKAVRTRWTGSMPQQMEDELGYFGAGRKYYFDKKSLRSKNLQDGIELKIELPEKSMTQIQSGPVITEKLSWFYTFKKQLKARTLQDSRTRYITNAWIHFEDGTNEKLPASKLPNGFSFTSEEEYRELEIEAKRRFQRYFDETAIIEDSPSAVKECKSLFGS